jgi:hypothetical protein
MTKAKQDREMVQMAPVAEYRRVAIVEMAGNKRAIWKGQEYTTDGLSWFIFRAGMAARFYQRFPSSQPIPESAKSTPPGYMSFLAVPDERQAKHLLDGIAKEGEKPSTFFLSSREMLDLLGAAPRKPLTQWDEEQGLFVA